MPRDPKYDVLFEPVQIGPKRMKNRFYQTPHCTGFGSDRPGTQAYFRAMKAEGGWAVVNTEWCSIHPEADEFPHVGARLWDDADVANLRWLCDMVHEHDALIGIELGFNGSHATGYETRTAARGIRQLQSDTFFWHSCYEMSRDELRELQTFYVAAATRARDAGFDIVNVMGAESCSIPVQLLMKRLNTRTDEYGGSLENRARFWTETLEQVRDAVGGTCAITARLCVDSLHPEGAGGIAVAEEGIGFIQLADHLVDFWDVQVGGPTLAEWGDDAGSSRFFSENSQRPWIEQLRPHTSKPIVGVGRFTNPDTMVAVIRSGQLDIIGAARPSIADPFLPKKIEEGRFDDIRECIGCNVCASRYEQGATLVCTQNATAGEEYRRRWHPERFSSAANAVNDVLVVGAGPAGMECAMVLGKRGMRRVHLVEAENELGGCLRWITTLPGLGEWGRVINYRQIQLAKLRNVEVIVGTRLERDDVLEYGAEIVVVATGAHWASDGLNGYSAAAIPGADAKLRYVLTPEQVTAGKDVPGERVVIVDYDGYYTGASVAEKLARDGKRVTIVTPLPEVAPYMRFTLELHRMIPQLLDLGVTLVPYHQVTEIGSGFVRGVHSYRASAVQEWPADATVLVTQRVSNSALFDQLASERARAAGEGITGVYRVGDAVAPRLLADTIWDGHRLAREIDTEEPATPLPFIRERRVVGYRDSDFESELGAAPTASATADGQR